MIEYLYGGEFIHFWQEEQAWIRSMSINSAKLSVLL
jgi:hypothetical protein